MSEQEKKIVVAEFNKGRMVAVTSGKFAGHRWESTEPLPEGLKVTSYPMSDLEHADHKEQQK